MRRVAKVPLDLKDPAVVAELELIKRTKSLERQVKLAAQSLKAVKSKICGHWRQLTRLKPRADGWRRRLGKLQWELQVTRRALQTKRKESPQ